MENHEKSSQFLLQCLGMADLVSKRTNTQVIELIQDITAIYFKEHKLEECLLLKREAFSIGVA